MSPSPKASTVPPLPAACGLRLTVGGKLDLLDPLPAFFDRVNARPAVQLALQHEGLA